MSANTAPASAPPSVFTELYTPVAIPVSSAGEASVVAHGVEQRQVVALQESTGEFDEDEKADDGEDSLVRSGGECRIGDGH
ncbi:hypothetical protein [Brevibacterium oceani]|uniref:hypothetical protein n=1 Tax=Brevibacterium oceani TaxID=358099 RepID=UPI001B3227F3|nr:hypothetical protein [Brevibacterium oceani]